MSAVIDPLEPSAVPDPRFRVPLRLSEMTTALFTVSNVNDVGNVAAWATQVASPKATARHTVLVFISSSFVGNREMLAAGIPPAIGGDTSRCCGLSKAVQSRVKEIL
jgi:hypothetical protein